MLFTSVATQGVTSSDETVFIERYRIEVAGEDGLFQYITPSTNSSQLEPAVSRDNLWFAYFMNCVHTQIFPLGQSRISNANRHTESLPRPVIGQILRINPYEWNNHDYACNKVEVYGCPLQGSSVRIAYHAILL